MTIGFARRFATYKRATLIFRDLERIKRILNDPERPVQLIFAGKAHPADEPGKALIKQIHQLSRQEGFEGRVIFLENYDIYMARQLVQGTDVWLNNPRRPLEASGTSGQKAGANGVPNLSVLDGWWVEGYNGRNGWAIGEGREYPNEEAQDEADALSLYNLLEDAVVPLYYETKEGDPRPWLAYVRESIRSIAPRFSTRRMLKEYLAAYYMPAIAGWHTYRADDFRVARDVAAWKARVRQVWPQVRVQAEGPEMARLRVGDEVEVQAQVTLNGLTPEDVRVEIVCGRLDDEGELRNVRKISMQLVEFTQGVAHYRGILRAQVSGQLAYGVRVYPYRPELPGPFDLALLTWA